MTDECRVKLLNTDDATGTMALYFKAVTQLLGRVPNTRRVGAHFPMMTIFQLPFTAVLQREGGGGLLSGKIKEMAIIKTSHLNGCNYWLAHNTSLGQAAGISEKQVQVIGSDDYMESSIFTPREKAAILWAEHVTLNTARHRDDVFEIVHKEYNDQ